jgi:hypothetical protein
MKRLAILLPLILIGCATPPAPTRDYSYFDDGYKLCLKKGHIEDSKEHRICIVQYVRAYRAKHLGL